MRWRVPLNRGTRRSTAVFWALGLTDFPGASFECGWLRVAMARWLVCLGQLRHNTSSAAVGLRSLRWWSPVSGCVVLRQPDFVFAYRGNLCPPNWRTLNPKKRNSLFVKMRLFWLFGSRRAKILLPHVLLIFDSQAAGQRSGGLSLCCSL